MTEHCTHSRIVAFVFDDGEPASFWACHHCKRKFVPLDLEQEKDAARYRTVRKMNARQFAALFQTNISGGGLFDDLIDEWEGK